MKIAAFSVRPDEKQYFDTFANVYKVELQILVSRMSLVPLCFFLV